MIRWSCLFALLLTTAPARAQEYTWIEGETPTTTNVKFEATDWGKAHYLSGGKWLFAGFDGGDVAKKIPAEGALFDYEFSLKSEGEHEVWARIGYEGARAPLQWRIDDGDWTEIKPSDLTTDLMSLGDWAEVAWLKLATKKLTAGKHTLHLKLDRWVKDAAKKEYNRTLFGIDAFCISKGVFHPNGPHKPDEDWKQEIDHKADKQIFAIKAGSTAAGERVVAPLSGLWQIARFDEREIVDRTAPLKALPDDKSLFWRGITVPGNKDVQRPDLTYCHRYFYRTRVKVDADLTGRSFVLRLPSNALIASVIVNGRYCGYSSDVCTNFECDITSALKPGEVNEVVVGIKSLIYGVERNDTQPTRTLFNYPIGWYSNGFGALRFADFPFLLQVTANGILEAPSLIVGGPAYTSDVFAKPSVKKKELGLEITLNNSTDKPLTVKIANEVVPLDGDKAEKTFAVKEETIPAKQEKTIELSEKWENPKLWWPDHPTQYRVVTTLSVDGKVIDVRRTKFGFREWEWQGQTFKLNGVPWHIHADTSQTEKGHPEESVKAWQRDGINTFRFWGPTPWVGNTQEETLDFFDKHGILVRRSSTFDGEAASYALTDGNKARPGLFNNWRHQLKAWVKGERNHPSVFIWSLENEITFINARNLGLLDFEEPEMKKAVAEVMALDPTRPAMIDGGDALRDHSLPIYGNHYNEANFREYPDEAYTMALSYQRYKEPRAWAPWPLADDKPLFLGESFFANGSPPSDYAAVSGESAFLGRAQARQGVTLFAKMLTEGYRWHGVAGFQFWFSEGSHLPHHNSFLPVAVFCREWNSCFAGGQEVKRTLKVFNDTQYDDPIIVSWVIKVGDLLLTGSDKEYKLAPGTAEEIPIKVLMPVVKKRTPGTFTLTCTRNGKEVFREEKPIAVIDPDSAAKPAIAKDDLIVFDPKGSVKARLTKRGIAFTEAATVEAIPAKAKVVVIGNDALTARQATDPRWLAMTAAGTRLLVLEQETPLHYQAVAADFERTPYTGRIAFVENLAHPAFAGLDQPDFFTWSKDHIVYRNAYKKASKGAKSLVQCDDQLSCSALSECPVGGSIMMLSQLVIGTKLATDPVAQKLFDNLLNYCVDYQPLARKTVAVFPANDLRLKLLETSGLRLTRTDDLLVSLADDKNEIVIADATPANLKKLADKPDALKAFTNRGGHLMLWGLTPEGLADYNKLVGFPHAIRPFVMERVTLPGVRNPILAGLTMRDVVLESTENIYPWAGDKYPANDTFTHIVDLDDIAPFCACPGEKYGWAQMTNGLVSADSWKFIFSHNLKDSSPHPVWTATLPKEEELTTFSITPNCFYHVLTKFKIYFNDNKDDAEILDLKPVMERQDFPIKPRKIKTISLEPLEWKAIGTAPVISVENIWMTVKRDEDYQKRVVPLLNIGGLVMYRMGKGGIILNQLRIQEHEANPVNGLKKQTIATTLLRNLGAAFSADRLVVAGSNLTYTPIPLGEKCNQFLTADKGWIEGQPDLSFFPVGENTLAGVRYQVRDFKTSPLPACIMLEGPKAKGTLAKSVTGIPVGTKADALFFLQGIQQTNEWKPTKEKPQPPAAFKYVVHYKDGETVDVLVPLTRGVANYVSDNPQGLPDAAIGWTAPFPKDEKRQAVVYQMQWTNPHPKKEIASIDVLYDKDGNQYGIPFVLAITAASAKE